MPTAISGRHPSPSLTAAYWTPPTVAPLSCRLALRVSWMRIERRGCASRSETEPIIAVPCRVFAAGLDVRISGIPSRDSNKRHAEAIRTFRNDQWRAFRQGYRGSQTPQRKSPNFGWWSPQIVIFEERRPRIGRMSAATIRGFAGVGDSTTTGVENASRVSVGARGERRTEVVGNSTRLNEHVPSGESTFRRRFLQSSALRLPQVRVADLWCRGKGGFVCVQGSELVNGSQGPLGSQ